MKGKLLPEFKVFGEDDPQVTEGIQPSLDLRKWSDLTEEEKSIAFQELKNLHWASEDQHLLETIAKLNDDFLRLCPGKNLHSIRPRADRYGATNDGERMTAAYLDFKDIFLYETNEMIVLRMLTLLAKSYIDYAEYNWAKDAESEEESEEYISSAFRQFDRLANCLNHIFEQFAVNITLTRTGLVPRQDQKIAESIYRPTLAILADPRWQSVSEDLALMFDDFQNKRYAEVITKAHGAVQRFLQILTGEEAGKNGKGELSSLFRKAKKDGLIPIDRFSEPIIGAIQSYLPSERANKSTAKPAVQKATARDALLVMNVVMIFFQHCLQNEK